MPVNSMLINVCIYDESSRPDKNNPSDVSFCSEILHKFYRNFQNESQNDLSTGHCLVKQHFQKYEVQEVF